MPEQTLADRIKQKNAAKGHKVPPMPEEEVKAGHGHVRPVDAEEPATKGGGKIRPLAPPKLPTAKLPKVPKDRGCCKTPSGKDAPHADNCHNNQAFRAELAAREKEASRLPDGATFSGTYNDSLQSWTIKLTAKIGDEEMVFSRSGSNHDKLFHQLAQECRAWMRSKKEASAGP